MAEDLNCSFCGKSKKEIEAMVVAGGESIPGPVICNECFELAAEQFSEHYHCKARDVYVVMQAWRSRQRAAYVAKHGEGT